MSKPLTYKDACNHVLAYHEWKPTLEHVAQQMAEGMASGEWSGEQVLRHQYGKRGNCKYCYTRHVHWYLSKDHWPPCWVCGKCDHATLDEEMRGN